MKKNLHSGHRQRMREKILRGDVESFTDHEILEFMLFYTIPRRNTNEIAHKLIDRFGSLAAIAEASIEEITATKIIGAKSAAFIKFFPHLAYYTTINTQPFLNSAQAVIDFAKVDCADADGQIIKMYCLSNSFRLATSSTLPAKSIEAIKVMDIINTSIKCINRNFMLVYLKTSSEPLISDAELKSIRNLIITMKNLQLELSDFVIITPDRSISLKDAGLI